MLPFRRSSNKKICAWNHFSHPELPKRGISAMEILMSEYLDHWLDQALSYRSVQGSMADPGFNERGGRLEGAETPLGEGAGRGMCRAEAR